MKNNKGFDLPEIMICIVIIGMLVAMAIPAFHKIEEREKEKRNKEHQEQVYKTDAERPRIVITDTNNPIGTEVVLNGKVYIIIEKKY